MAAAFLAGHGIDLDEELTNAFSEALSTSKAGEDKPSVEYKPSTPTKIKELSNIILDGEKSPRNITFDTNGCISALEVASSEAIQQPTRLLFPSLCHPHIHLDKPFLLSHADTSHLAPETGDFEEALSLTSKAKPLYTPDALLERGAQLLADSSRAGVTHVRAFCEVDTSVGHKCIEAGLELKNAWKDSMFVQIAAFAQDPLFSTKLDGTGQTSEDEPSDFIPSGNQNHRLMIQAYEFDGVDVLATTPYVEASLQASKLNIEWAIDTAIERKLYLDLHLDYNLDADQEPLVWHVLEKLKQKQWTAKNQGKTVCLGHCTRLTLFGAHDWTRLAQEVTALPVYFVGLPTSDLFMQGRGKPTDSGSGRVACSHNRPRSTLHIPSLLELGINGVLGVNNVGNAFTPYGSADPLRLTEWCVGIFQNGTPEAAKILYDCVSWRAKEAIGCAPGNKLDAKHSNADSIVSGESADCLIVSCNRNKKFNRTRKSVEEVVWDPPQEVDRTTIYRGSVVNV